MKSWKKLREFARFKEKGNGGVEPTQDIEEITKGMQDVQQMKAQYEGLHAVSSRVVGRAYGLSEAIHELATFLMNTFGVAAENGEINQVYKEVSRVQFELSKLLHLYALHVSGTLTLPTESLLNELDHIEETKKQYDEKRTTFDHMRVRKTKARGGKAEVQADHLLQDSKEQFDELAMILGCRLHSLEQSRPRNLLTQAVRHHGAQMHLFKQGLCSLDEIDSFVSRLVHDRNLDQTLDYLDADNELHSAVFDKAKEGEDSDRSSSVEQETSHFEDRRPSFPPQDASGSKSAPISPMRFAETNGVNSIHEVMLDGVSKNLPTFSRTNSWFRRKASRDPGVLHLYRPTSSSTAQVTHPYSVTEPSASPAPSWIKTPERQRLTPQRHHHHHQQHQQQEQLQQQQQQQKKKLSSFPSLPRRAAAAQSGPLVSVKPRVVIPGSGPLSQAPPSQVLPADPLYKSGPLNATGKVSPVVGTSSPPRVSELHKLPPPPLSCTGASTSVVSAAAHKLIPHSAPLARPVQQQHHVVHSSAGAQASPLPPPPLAQAPSPASSKGVQKSTKRNEERVSPLPPNLSPNNNV